MISLTMMSSSTTRMVARLHVCVMKIIYVAKFQRIAPIPILWIVNGSVLRAVSCGLQENKNSDYSRQLNGCARLKSNIQDRVFLKRDDFATMISMVVELMRPGIHGSANIVTVTATGGFLCCYR